MTIIKGRNLGLACYSLMLDGLAQEGGAVLRPLLESIELTTYFRLDPSRVEDFLNDRLPRAGEIAQQINGRFHALRKYLNDHSSHFGLTFENIQHIVDLNTGSLRPSQQLGGAANKHEDALRLLHLLGDRGGELPSSAQHGKCRRSSGSYNRPEAARAATIRPPRSVSVASRLPNKRMQPTSASESSAGASQPPMAGSGT